ncbi:hypothetical protein [Xylophilus sp. GOD-11R]|uniref:hypothetical protein n=1 Tax=Xylophilus sp. GOD-11R TaxID=3089814 RepID=UPI00298D4098|nr:hypothetical protein [Xylophilus sp. GOD-11R]WPB58199.1 hypothetical protein R9X41_06045 [Xylophilus sp. GOD-11R]
MISSPPLNTSTQGSHAPVVTGTAGRPKAAGGQPSVHITVTTSHPTSAFSQLFDIDVAGKIRRNHEHRYETPASVRGKYERYLDKRIRFVDMLQSGQAGWSAETWPPGFELSPQAVQRLQQTCDSGEFRKPTVQEEAQRTLEQIGHVIESTYALADAATSAERAAVQAQAQPRTWAARDNDRSTVKFGDHARMFAAQVEHCCHTYAKLLQHQASGHPFFATDAVQALLSRGIAIARGLQQLLDRPELDAAGRADALRRFLAAPEHSLAAIEADIRTLCSHSPGSPFSLAVDKHGLTGFAGEVRINGAGLLPGAAPADRARIDEVLDEIAMVQACYPDTRSIVIADFSDLEQVDALRCMLDARGVAPEIIPLVESVEDAHGFMHNVAEFQHHGVRTVMAAGSDLARVAGTPQAIVLHHLMHLHCLISGMVFYFGNGTSMRRNGEGVDGCALRQQLALRPFATGNGGQSVEPETRSTLQGGAAALALGNTALARRHLLQRGGLKPVEVVPEEALAEAAQAAEVFADITKHELAARRTDGDFSRFYRAHPAIRDLRNASAHHGSRDGVKPGLQHLYEDRAINADASMELFNLAASFAWSDLDRDPGALSRLVTSTRASLAEGNAVVQRIVLNYAIQASTVFFEDQCREKWAAAGFSEEAIERLAASRAVLLDFVAACGHDLAQDIPLQRSVMEFIGIAEAFHPTDAAANLRAIEQRRRRCNDAGIRALHAMTRRDDQTLSPEARKLAALDLHLNLTAAYVLGAGVKS